MDKTKRRNLIAVIVIGVVVAAMVLSAFIMLTRTNGTDGTEDTLELTDVQKLTSTDLSVNYPASAPAVIDYYYRVYQTLYGYECSAQEVQQLTHQIWMLLDTDLQAKNPEQELLMKTQAEVSERKSDGLTISSYVIPSAREINDSLTRVNGRDAVSADIVVTMRKGQVRSISYYTFILRKDADNHWKIYGWTETGNRVEQ